jgi:hypothetical protein
MDAMNPNLSSHAIPPAPKFSGRLEVLVEKSSPAAEALAHYFQELANLANKPDRFISTATDHWNQVTPVVRPAHLNNSQVVNINTPLGIKYTINAHPDEKLITPEFIAGRLLGRPVTLEPNVQQVFKPGEGADPWMTGYQLHYNPTLPDNEAAALGKKHTQYLLQKLDQL